MKLKTQIKIYQNLVSELGGKFEAEDFISKGIKQLCLEHGILEEEVRFCIFIFLCYVYSLATYTV